MKKLGGVLVMIGLACVLIVPLTTTSQEKEVDKLEFVGAQKCKMCHNLTKFGKFHDDWAQTKHAKAIEVLNDEEKKNPDCLKCHTTGYGKPGGFVSLEKTEALANVQCEMCHGPGEVHIKSKRGKEVLPHAWEPEEKTCKVCHNPESPTWKEDRYVDPETGEKSGFNYKMAVQKINHAAVLKELGKEPKTSK